MVRFSLIGHGLKPPGDLLSFDYSNSRGTHHLAVVSHFDGRRYGVVDAMPGYGVTCHPLAHPSSRATIKAWGVKELVD